MIKEHFYNTNESAPAEANKAELRAMSQESELYGFMMKRGGEWNCWSLKAEFPTWEITSIRRALFNLENKDHKIVRVGWVKGEKGMRVGSFTIVWSGKLF